jgi:hypothetical protein
MSQNKKRNQLVFDIFYSFISNVFCHKYKESKNVKYTPTNPLADYGINYSCKKFIGIGPVITLTINQSFQDTSLKVGRLQAL